LLEMKTFGAYIPSLKIAKISNFIVTFE